MKRLLVVTVYFAPSSLIGAQRPVKLVRRIGEFGWEPYVLTVPLQCQRSVVPGTGEDVLARVPVVTVPCRSVWLHGMDYRNAKPGWPRIVAQAQRFIAKLTSPLMPVDAAYPWVRAATGTGVKLVQRHEIDLIWATSPPLSALCLARSISRVTGVPYVADFRDVTRADGAEPLSRRDRFNNGVEREILRDAGGVIYVSPPQLSALVDKHPFVAELPTCLAYNWFEQGSPPAESPDSAEEPTILHGGDLYGHERRVGGLVEAMALLRRGGSARARSIRLVQYGMPHRARSLVESAAGHGLSDVVQVRAGLPEDQFMAACRAADILLVAVGRNAGIWEHAGAIPGKVFDYFAAGRPILVVGPEGCEAGKLVQRVNRGLTVPDDAPDQIAEAIERLLIGRGASGELDLTPPAVAEFEASAAVERLAGLLREVASRR